MSIPTRLEPPNGGTCLFERTEVRVLETPTNFLDLRQQRPQILRLRAKAAGLLERQRQARPKDAPYLGPLPIGAHRVLAHATQLSALRLGLRQLASALVAEQDSRGGRRFADECLALRQIPLEPERARDFFPAFDLARGLLDEALGQGAQGADGSEIIGVGPGLAALGLHGFIRGSCGS